MEAQLAMTQLLKDADERARTIRDLHYGRVQALFDELPPESKKLLGLYMMEHEWDTCAALSVAACDWHRTQPKKPNGAGS